MAIHLWGPEAGSQKLLQLAKRNVPAAWRCRCCADFLVVVVVVFVVFVVVIVVIVVAGSRYCV